MRRRRYCRRGVMCAANRCKLDGNRVIWFSWRMGHILGMRIQRFKALADVTLGRPKYDDKIDESILVVMSTSTASICISSSLLLSVESHWKNSFMALSL